MIITDNAKLFIEEAMKGSAVKTLRILSAGSGCCGPSIGMELAHAENGDITKEVNGISVAIDASIAELAEKMTLDLDGEGDNGGLVIRGGGCC